MRSLPSPDGRVLVHEDAVAAVAGLAALDCPGVAGMAARGLQDGLADILGRENPGRGVEVELDDEHCSIILDVIIHYGVRIADVVAEATQRVRAAVEETTGIAVERVELRIEGVRPPR